MFPDKRGFIFFEFHRVISFIYILWSHYWLFHWVAEVGASLFLSRYHKDSSRQTRRMRNNFQVLKNRLITQQPQYFIASALPFLSASLPSLASSAPTLFLPIHPSGRNLLSKYEELVWSSPPLGLMSFWLCPSTRLFCTSAELVLCVQMGTWRAGVHPMCFVSHTCVFALHTETWFPAPCHRKCPATY